MSRLYLLTVFSVALCSSVAAEDFVPFVIPAKPNPDSLIAVKSYSQIQANSNRLVAEAGHFYQGGERVRLWGVNLSFGANFPKKEDAENVAARLAAAGVNTVRCHHMDTSRWPRGLWNPDDGKTIYPEALDRLDYFIDQLAKHGIFVNINLHVGRAHSEYMGLPKANREYDKICGIFAPALVDAQKQFARELLSHLNKYRNVRYADDPAVAIVEITNEDSLFMWGAENTLRTLPPYYAEVLRRKYNEWLKNRYGSDEKLRKAWSEGAEPLGENLVSNGNFQADAPGINAPAGWNLEQHQECKAGIRPQQYQSKQAVRIEIVKADDTEWHLQLTQPGLSMRGGRYYTVTFEAAADKPRSINCAASQAHSPWDNLGLSQQAQLTEAWQKFSYGFVAKAGDDNARISFSFGASDVPIYLANVELRPGGQVGLADGESAESGTVQVFGSTETRKRVIDRLCFLAETEKAYFDTMRGFIKQDLGCKALVAGTIVFGPLGLYAQSDMDFIDAHAYWQHPRFPGRPWDSENWVVEQKAMTDSPAEATLLRLAAERLAGKPFTVSEYNHPAPSDFQGECVPMIASFAALQDWDGVWLYTYSHGTDDWARQALYSYFDVDANPAKWGFMRAGATILRASGIAPVSATILVPLAESSESLTSLAAARIEHGDSMFALMSQRAKAMKQDMLSCRLIADLGRGTIQKLAQPSAAPGQLSWSVEDGRGFYMARGHKADVYIGHAERFGKATQGRISISSPAFVSLTMTSLDELPLDRSRTILISAVGRCENTGMKFSADRRTVGRNWGGPPVQIEAVTGKIVIPGGKWNCQTIGPDGVATGKVPIRIENKQAAIEVSAQYKTMWYLLTRTAIQD